PGGDHVVHAHRHQVDAEPVQPPGSGTEQDLGADAIAAGGDRGVTGAGRVQTGEATQTPKHVLCVRRLDGSGDAAHHLVGGPEADPGVAVGERRLAAHRAAAASAAASSSNRSLAFRMSPGISVGYSPVRQARQKRSLDWLVDDCSPSSDRYASEVAPSRSRTCSMVRPEAISSFWSAMSIP